MTSPMAALASISLIALGCGGGGGTMSGYSYGGMGGGGGGGGGGGTCSGATPVALTVKNFLAWCDVTVAGMAASTAESQTVCVADGAATLTAEAVAGFQLGTAPWHDVDGDNGTGTLGTVTGTGQTAVSTVKKTVSGTAVACAWVCCETAATPGDCPKTDQCP